jgi:anhydro-N-acetylmuramic acid kinase
MTPSRARSSASSRSVHGPNAARGNRTTDLALDPHLEPGPHLVLGLMSGTSADGIDVALVRVGSSRSHSATSRPRGSGTGAPDTAARDAGALLENFVSLPYPTAVRNAVLRIAEGAPASAAALSQLNFRLGQVFAQAALKACQKFRVNPRRITLIGSHGQTVFHQGAPSAFAGARVASTLQIGEPAVIAALTGITTVGDFRPADMAVGGQGAPLVPFVDYLLYRKSGYGRIALNIGGIANLTVIPPAARPQDVFALDTGPGNMVIDALVRHFTRDRRQYDNDARIAMAGRAAPALLDSLLAAEYFRRPPPKTAGREQFGLAYAQQIIKWGRTHHTQPADLVRTATLLTPLSIAAAIHRWVLPRARVSQLILAGGGARNPLIVAQLRAALTGIEIISSGALGVPADAKEAFAFALLAHETLHRRPSNLPGATGAARPAILGKICYAPPR